MVGGGFIQRESVNIPARALTVDGDDVVCEAPFAGVLADASFTPEGNITGDNTNKRTMTIVNKGGDGNGTTVMATLDFVTGVNATDFNEQAFTLSAVAHATEFAQGDIIVVVDNHAGGTGLAGPGGLVTVGMQRSYE